MKRFIISLVILFLVASGLLIQQSYVFLKAKPSKTHNEKIIDILPGSTPKHISNILAKERVVTSDTKFYLLIRILNRGKDIKAAEYQFFTDIGPLEVLDILTSGKPYLHKVSVPEGSSMNQIGDILENKEIVSKEEFLKAAHDSELLKRNGIEANSAEGYLFPETYSFAKRSNGRDVVNKMLNTFQDNYDPAWDVEGKKYNFSRQQIVTLASIIEKETGVPSERPLISAVMHNRLKQGMKLQSDPTVIYGIPSYSGNITKRDLLTRTPYNTYTNYGLPPGPIASPGKESLRAAVFPANVKYIFFVSKNDGSHTFTETYKEHLKKVEKHQIEPFKRKKR